MYFLTAVDLTYRRDPRHMRHDQDAGGQAHDTETMPCLNIYHFRLVVSPVHVT